MTLLCRIGLHRFLPCKTFRSQLYLENRYHKDIESMTGYQCHCGKRRVRRRWAKQTAGATQEAYDWLNARPPKGQVLSLVKNDNS